MKLTDWKARRAGGRITVTGTDESGRAAKIVGVDVIEPDRNYRGYARAVDKDGTYHLLAI